MVDLIRKMIEPRQSERIGLLEIANHPWMAGFEAPAGTVVPKPIVFYQVNVISDILKFRRMFVNIDREVLRRTCEFLKLEDKRQLEEALNEGMITDETTVYYLMTKPLQEEPRIPRPPGPSMPPKSNRRKSIVTPRAVKAAQVQAPRISTPIIRRPEIGARSPRLRGHL
jgi:hypothetical protein